MVIFPYNSLYTQAVAYTTYFELGEPVGRPKTTWTRMTEEERRPAG